MSQNNEYGTFGDQLTSSDKSRDFKSKECRNGENKIESDPVTYDIDSAIASFGGFGRYQQWLAVLLVVLIAPLYATNMTQQFLILLQAPFRCNSPEFGNLTFFDANFSQIDYDETSQCAANCSDGYRYDHSLIYPTIVSQQNWICHDSWKIFFSHSAYWGGSIFGATILGFFSDRFGRVWALNVCFTIAGLAGLGTIFSSQHLIVFLVARFFMGFVVLSQGAIGLVLVMEFVSTPYRLLVSTLFLLSFTVFSAALPWFAFWLADWKLLVLVTSLPMFTIPILIIFKQVPESIRWLALNDHKDRTLSRLKRIQHFNNSLTESISLSHIRFPVDTTSSFRQSFKKSPGFRKVFILTNIVWFLQDMGVNGGNIYASAVSTNPFLMLSINAVIDIVATLITNCLADRYGRKNTTVWSCSISAIAFMSMLFFGSTSTMALLVLFFGRFMLTVGNSVQYLYAAEIYPTAIRSTSMALRMSIGSSGSLISSQVVSLAIFGPNIPIGVFGLCVLVTAGTMFYLPETLNQSLPETIDDVEEILRKDAARRRRKSREAERLICS